jgi:hypothetical protein
LFKIAAARIVARLATEGEVVGEGEGVGEGVGEGEGFVEVDGLTLDPAIFTPLPHTSLEPDLTQVYLMPEATVVELSLLHVVPVLVAALAGVLICASKREVQIMVKNRCFMSRF